MATVTITICDQDNGEDLAIHVESDSPENAPMTLAESAAASALTFLGASAERTEVVPNTGGISI